MYVVRNSSGEVVVIATRQADVKAFTSDTKDNRGNTITEIKAEK